LILLAPAMLLPSGCSGIECEDVKAAICDKACVCDFCQLEFSDAGTQLLQDKADCVLTLSSVVCSSETDDDRLQACFDAVESSNSGCPYRVPSQCDSGGAFGSDS